MPMPLPLLPSHFPSSPSSHCLRAEVPVCWYQLRVSQYVFGLGTAQTVPSLHRATPISDFSLRHASWCLWSPTSSLDQLHFGLAVWHSLWKFLTSPLFVNLLGRPHRLPFLWINPQLQQNTFTCTRNAIILWLSMLRIIKPNILPEFIHDWWRAPLCYQILCPK